MSVTVILTKEQLAKATEVGLARNAYAERRALRNYYGSGETGFTDASHHVVGAIAEVAVSQHFNLPWEPNVGNLDGVDVGGKVEVRARRSPGSGTDLAIRPRDKDDKPHVQCLVEDGGVVHLIGWLYGREGKNGNRSGRWNETSRVWYVPPPYREIEALEALLSVKPESPLVVVAKSERGPWFYTEAQLDAAASDAERLGYRSRRQLAQ